MYIKDEKKPWKQALDFYNSRREFSERIIATELNVVAFQPKSKERQREDENHHPLKKHNSHINLGKLSSEKDSNCKGYESFVTCVTWGKFFICTVQHIEYCICIIITVHFFYCSLILLCPVFSKIHVYIFTT